ncbi:MAG: ComEA family DNA-binding protein [Huintestinicola sp.]
MDMKKAAFGVAASMFIAAASVTGASYIIDKRAANEPEPVIKIIRAEETSASDNGIEFTASEEYTSCSSSEPEIHSIDICTADTEELMTLPGIGEKIAANIIEYRSENRFSVPEDIMNVKGIGEKKFKDIEPFIYIGTAENNTDQTGK